MAVEFTEDQLYGGSNINQMWKDFIGKTNGSGDELRDVYMIMTGISNAPLFLKIQK